MSTHRGPGQPLADVQALLEPSTEPAPLEMPPGEVAAPMLQAVPVKTEAADSGTAVCITLSANNPIRQLLPADPRRRSAVILAVDNDVYITSSLAIAMTVEGNATSTNAFYLPAGIGIPVNHKTAMWAAATTTATSSRISVLISRDEE